MSKIEPCTSDVHSRGTFLGFEVAPTIANVKDVK